MKKTFTHIFLGTLFTCLMLFVSFNQSNSQTAVRRVLLEEVTGAWCPWCPIGIQQMEDLLKKYGDKLNGIAIHCANGDAMQNNDGLTLVTTLGVSSYPSGFADRNFALNGQTPTWNIPPNYWDQYVSALLALAPQASIDLTYTLDPSTRLLKAEVTSTFLQAVNNECRLNVFVVEDEVTGTGAGYDQKNNLSNNPQYAGHPFYSKPANIVGFKHMNVLRAALGTALGQANSIPDNPPVVGKKYKYTFNYTVPANFNIDKIRIIGTVGMYSTQYADRLQFLNSIAGKKGTGTTEFTSEPAPIQSAGQTESGFADFSIKNISTTGLVYTWKIDKSGRTPADWTASVETASGDITVQAGQTANFKLRLAPGATPGIGDATLTVAEKANQNNKWTVDLTVLSKDVERLQVLADGVNGTQSITSNLKTAGYNNFIDIKPTELVDVDLLSKLKTIVWAAGELGEMSSADGSKLLALAQTGKNLFIYGNVVVPMMDQTASSLQSLLGMKYTGPCYQGYSAPNQIVIAGYAGDPISDGYETMGKLIRILTPNIVVTDLSTTKPFLKHKFTDTIIAVRTQIDKNRAAVLGFTPSVITDASMRQSLIKKIIDWVEGIGGANLGPQIQVSETDIQFDKVAVDRKKAASFKIQNIGDDSLVVTEIKTDATVDPDGVFKLVNLQQTPFSILPNGEVTINVEFTPKATKDYTGSILIVSNSIKKPNELVSLSGTGDPSGDVKELSVINGVFRVQASPNPANGNAFVSYTLEGNETKTVDMVLIDMSGRKVSDIVNSNILPGTYTWQMNTSALTSGTYYVTVRIDGKSMNIPLVIAH